MPPRSARRLSGGAAKKAAGRTGKTTPKAASRAEAPASTVEVEEDAKVEQVTAAPAVEETKEEIRAEEVVEEKPVILDLNTRASGSMEVENDNDLKEAFEEEFIGERLELEDNEPEDEPDDEAAVEYEPEDETAVDYGERDIDHDGEEVDGDEDEEDGGEGDDGDEEEADLVNDIDDVVEDVEGEDDDNADEHEIEAEEEEHHKVVKEHRKSKEFEVFVGGLDKDATEDDLRKVFTQFGEITEVRLVINPMTKKNKGFAFLRFATVDQAKRALSEMKNPVVRGKQCGIAPSQDSDTLFLGNICKTWTKERLKEQLKTYGVENVEDITLVADAKNEGMSRGFAFLEFSSRSTAMDAYRRLQKRDVVFGLDRSAKVALADSFNEPDEEIMAQVSTVFIDGLPASWDEDRVNEYLKKYGVIEKIQLARNMPAAKRRNFGFVTFDTHDNAVACADGINDKELGEGDNKVKVRARLSRPHKRGKAKHGIRGNFRIGRGTPRVGRTAYPRPPPRRIPVRPSRPVSSHSVAGGRGRTLRRPLGYSDRRPVMTVERPRRLPPPERPYERRPPVSPYAKSTTRRDYGRCEEIPPSRNRPPVDYPRIPTERRPSYRDNYSSRESVYSDMPPRNVSRPADRRAYVDDGYGRKLERPLPTYREGHSHEYDSIAGSKRPYSDLDDSRYADVNMRHSRARMDYGVTSSNAQYGDTYGDRLGRSHVGYNISRAPISNNDSLYTGRRGMNYGGGSVSGSDVGGMYSSDFNDNYMPRGSDVGGSSYSSLYSSRSLGGSGYMRGSGSSSYY